MAKLKEKIVCCSRKSNFDVKTYSDREYIRSQNFFLWSYTCTYSVKQFYFQSRAIYFLFLATDDFCWMKQVFATRKKFPVELLDGLVIPKSGESVSVLQLLQLATFSNMYPLILNC